MTIEDLVRESYQDSLEAGSEKTASKKSMDLGEFGRISESLSKVASLPYKEEAYGAVCGIMKLASQSIGGFLTEYKKQSEKVKELEKISEIRGLIDEMIENGHISKFDVQEKTAALLKKSYSEIEVVKEAIKLANKSVGANIFSAAEQEKTASVPGEKAGMFDTVI